jgi:hypothetical protein
MAWNEQGALARDNASRYGTRFAGDRAAMVVDVVASRQRRYSTRVTRLVAEFRTSGITALYDLANCRSVPLPGLRSGEAETMVAVAGGLLAWGVNNPSPLNDDDHLVGSWAARAAPFDLAPSLDSFVGTIKGIGPAPYAYLRMRSGADGIKPDVRVRKHLIDLGFVVPRTDCGLLLVAWAAAEDLGVSKLELDH